MTKLEPVIIEESKTHSLEYIMKKKRELYELKSNVEEKLRRLKKEREEFRCLLFEFAKTNVPKAHRPQDVLRFLRGYESLHRYMAHTEIPDTTTFREYYEFNKEIVAKWNLKDVKEMFELCCHAFKNLTPFQVWAKIIVDNARQYCKLYEAYEKAKSEAKP